MGHIYRLTVRHGVTAFPVAGDASNRHGRVSDDASMNDRRSTDRRKEPRFGRPPLFDTTLQNIAPSASFLAVTGILHVETMRCAPSLTTPPTVGIAVCQ